ncbi:YncE family protein [Bacillus wiedmannii]|uniref:YncE family protein n=1 Tax=Bacillus wiedmannii TaxID=1890302 RepID=UPI000BF5B830|nr:exosporium leader peptide-containing protein [Bacillus wiedmannii]PFZ86913.1 hypothetical protein COL83_26925 [Bacillus wiedmannii]
MNYIGPTLPPMQPFQFPTGLPASETTCFQNIRTTLQHCTGGYFSLCLSVCCNPIQGQIYSVGQGSIIFVSPEGRNVIPICNIISVTSIIFTYVTTYDGAVYVINTSSNTVIAAPIPVGSTPTNIAITPDDSRAYVTNANASTVSVISPLPIHSLQTYLLVMSLLLLHLRQVAFKLPTKSNL